MYKRWVKRWVDLMGILIIVALFFWLFILIVFVYSLTLQFPIFFSQQRIGSNTKPFWLIKFRTLSVKVNSNLQERRFWLGDILRYLSLDELPQVWNVLKGEMSLVGPRPLPMEYLPLMNEEQKLRHQVKPGITGWAQVNGRHGISWEQKFKLDHEYVSNISFWFDLKILMKTFLLFINPVKDRSLEEKKFERNA